MSTTPESFESLHPHFEKHLGTLAQFEKEVEHNLEILKEAVTANDAEAIRRIGEEIVDYEAQATEIRKSLFEISEPLERGGVTRSTIALLQDNSIHLRKVLKGLHEYINAYHEVLALQTGVILPKREMPDALQNAHNELSSSIFEQYELWSKQNRKMLADAVEAHDTDTIEKIGDSITDFEKEETDIIRSRSEIFHRLEVETLTTVARALLENDVLRLNKVLEDIQSYIAEYKEILQLQLEKHVG